MKSLKALISASLFALATGAAAGPFNVDCYAEIGRCADQVKDLVTDRFTTKFPADRWQITALAEFQTYSDGGGVGYAVVGVVPRGSGQVPLRRFTATRRITGASVSPYEQATHLREIFRNAVTYLMAHCENTENCDIYEQNKNNMSIAAKHDGSITPR